MYKITQCIIKLYAASHYSSITLEKINRLSAEAVKGRKARDISIISAPVSGIFEIRPSLKRKEEKRL